MKRMVCFLLALAVSYQSIAQADRTSPGKLIIIGGGTIPDTLYQIFAEACGGKDQPIVVIPTATGEDSFIQQGGHLKRFRERGFSDLFTVHTRDRSKAEDPDFINAVKRARGIFIGGGDQQRLADMYAGTALHKAMLDLLARGGVIMGTSAGATIMGSELIGGDHRKSPHIKAQFPKGFSFLSNTAIDQHVLARNRQFDLVPVLEADSSLFGIAIDESTAAIVERGIVSVVGRSYVMIYDQQDWKKQMKEWGRVYRPFRMIRESRYDLVDHKETR